jgi:hypothetical protein
MANLFLGYYFLVYILFYTCLSACASLTILCFAILLDVFLVPRNSYYLVLVYPSPCVLSSAFATSSFAFVFIAYLFTVLWPFSVFNFPPPSLWAVFLSSQKLSTASLDILFLVYPRPWYTLPLISLSSFYAIVFLSNHLPLLYYLRLSSSLAILFFDFFFLGNPFPCLSFFWTFSAVGNRWYWLKCLDLPKNISV